MNVYMCIYTHTYQCTYQDILLENTIVAREGRRAQSHWHNSPQKTRTHTHAHAQRDHCSAGIHQHTQKDTHIEAAA